MFSIFFNKKEKPISESVKKHTDNLLWIAEATRKNEEERMEFIFSVYSLRLLISPFKSLKNTVLRAFASS